MSRNIPRYLAFAAMLFLAVFLRYTFIEFRSDDYLFYFGKWYAKAREHGLFHSFRYSFDNYTPLYIHFISFVALLPLSGLFALKLLSFIFEALGALYIGKIIYHKHKNSALSIFAALSYLCLPTVILNGACWAQSDTIYTCFTIASIYYMMRGNWHSSFILLGFAVSLKLQAVFILPFFLVLSFRHKQGLLYFLYLPAVYALTIIPSLVAGRNWADLLLIYYGQATGTHINMNAPNLYTWIPQAGESFQLWNKAGIFAGAALSELFILYILRHAREKIDEELFIKAALWITLMLPFVLPQIHERYFFLADVLSCLYFFYYRKNIFIPVLIVGSSTLTHSAHLFGITLIDRSVLAALLLAVLLFLSTDLHRTLLKTKRV